MNIPNDEKIKSDGFNTRPVYRIMFLTTLEDIENSIIRLLYNKYQNYDFVTKITNNLSMSKKQLNYITKVESNFGYAYLISHLDKMLLRITKEYVEATKNYELYYLASKCIILKSYIRVIL